MEVGKNINYKIEKAIKSDIPKLIDYKLKNILEYANNLSNEEIDRINNYVKQQVSMQLKNYKIICINNNKIGCLLVENNGDGVLLNEIYLEEKYRNKGIGTDIIKKLISENNLVYLWVYNLNIKAISLYMKLGFKIAETTETRYYMKYSK